MNYKEESLEFNLKDLLFYILYRWKPIVIGAIIVALLLGIVQAYPQYKTATSVESSTAYQEAQQNYNEQLALYEKNIASIQDKINNLKEYTDFSILMNADYRNVYIAKSVYYIDTNYQIILESQYQDPNKTKTVTWYYQNHLQDYRIYATLSETLGIEEKYLMELVTAEEINDDTLSVCVVHPDPDIAQRILQYLDEALLQYQDSLSSIVAEHSLTQMMHTYGISVYEPLEEMQQQVSVQMLTLQEELSQQKQEMKQFQNNSKPDSINVYTTFMKWCIVGGLAGGVLLVVLFFLAGIFDNRVYSPDYLATRYSIAFLGGFLSAGAKFDVITRWLRRQECLLLDNSQENIQYLAMNVRNHCATVKDILVCSDAAANTTVELVSSLQEKLPDMHFDTAGSLLSDAHALQSLPKCDSVLLLITRKQTHYIHISKSLAQIQECSKNVLGFIFID